MKKEKVIAQLTIKGISEMSPEELKRLLDWIKQQAKDIRACSKNPGFAKKFTAKLYEQGIKMGVN